MLQQNYGKLKKVFKVSHTQVVMKFNQIFDENSIYLLISYLPMFKYLQFFIRVY